MDKDFAIELAAFMADEDPGLLSDVRDLIDGRITWDEVHDTLGVDVETGNTIPYGKKEA
jgi:hypothetical protein